MKSLKNMMSGALPWYVTRRLPSPQLLQAWPELVGPYLASRAAPVSLNEDGVLVLAIRGAALRQELAFSAQELAARLAAAGFAVAGIKTITSRPPFSPPPASPPGRPVPELTLPEKQRLALQAGQLQNRRLRAALLNLLEEPGKRRDD